MQGASVHWVSGKSTLTSCRVIWIRGPCLLLGPKLAALDPPTAVTRSLRLIGLPTCRSLWTTQHSLPCITALLPVEVAIRRWVERLNIASRSRYLRRLSNRFSTVRILIACQSSRWQLTKQALLSRRNSRPRWRLTKSTKHWVKVKRQSDTCRISLRLPFETRSSWSKLKKISLRSTRKQLSSKRSCSVLSYR